MANLLPGETVTLSNGSMGHVLSDKTESGIRTVVIETQADASTLKVAQNLDVISKLSASVDAVKVVYDNLEQVKESLALKDSMKNVIAQKENIQKLALIDNSLPILATNLEVLKKLADEMSVVKGVSSELEKIRFLWEIRSALYSLNEIKDTLSALHKNIPLMQAISNKSAEITHVYDHMLAIEIVAQNIDLLKFFKDNIADIKVIAGFKNELVILAKNLDVYKEVIAKLGNLDKIVQEVGAKLDGAKNNAIETFKTEAKAVMDQLQTHKDDLTRERNTYLTEMLKLRTDVATLKETMADKLLMLEKEYRGHSINNTITTTENTTETSNTTAYNQIHCNPVRVPVSQVKSSIPINISAKDNRKIQATGIKGSLIKVYDSSSNLLGKKEVDTVNLSDYSFYVLIDVNRDMINEEVLKVTQTEVGKLESNMVDYKVTITPSTGD